MQAFKRTMALVLTLVMVFSIIPVGAFAAEHPAAPELDTGNVTIEGTNGFGNLLSTAISEEQEATAEAESEFGAGYTVTDLKIEGNAATVTYDSAEEAVLVVALYSEDGMQLLASGKATVTPDATEATVTIEGTMPEYFQASAYLVDSYDFSPLCAAYDTPIYTREMQELLSSTIHDYDPELVLNLDEDENTNFAVYTADVIRVEETEGRNIVTTCDDDNLLYVIENADETFTSLQAGDVVSYAYGENELLLVKVAAIAVEGTTVTITGDSDMELEDAFDYLKLEVIADNADLETVDGSAAAQQASAGDIVPMGDNDASVEVMPIRYEFAGKEKEYFDGYMEVLLDNKMDFLFSKGYIYYRWELEYAFSANFTVKVDNEDDEKEWVIPVLKEMRLVNIASFGLVFSPEFVFRASGSFTVNTTLSGSIGISCATGRDPINISKPLKVTDQVKIEGKLFMGFDLRPGFYVLHEKIFYIEMGVPVGINVTGEMSGETEGFGGTKEVLHECNACIAGEVYGSVGVNVSIKFFDKKNIEMGGSVEKKFLSQSFYWSITHLDIGWGSCPYKLYLVTVETVDTEGLPVGGVELMLGELGETTSEAGIAQAYLPAGRNNISVTYNGQTDSWALTVSSEPTKMKIILGAEHTEFIFEEENFGTETGGGLADYGAVARSGRCGDSVYWKQYRNNILQIYGAGDMDDYESNSDTPWWTGYDLPISEVIIEDGVTSIGKNAFYYFINMRRVTIPESVTHIGDRAFCWCSALEEIKLPAGLTYLGESAFHYCDSLRGVIVVPEGITEIKQYAFSAMSGNHVEEIILPKSLRKIGYCAFYKCGFTQITIPASVTYIGGYAFRWCENLEKIVFTGDAPEIVSYAFEGTKATAYYPADNDTWTSNFISQFRNLTWVPYTLDENGDMIINEAAATVETEQLDAPVEETEIVQTGLDVPSQDFAREDETVDPDAVYGGEYGTEVTDSYTIKTASFSGLVPGADYLLLAMKSIEVEDPLAADNLLFIDQAQALEDGTLVFTYVQREAAGISYVVACGASNKNLKDAVITFPEMKADGGLHVVAPTVVYDGKTLTEGKDYTITGAVSFTEAGTYTCYIRGIHNYTGLVACTYTVKSPSTAKFTTISTSLGGNIAMNFYMELSKDLVADPNAYIQFTYAGKTLNVPLSEGVLSGGVYRFSCPITSKNMTDEITAQVYNGNGPVGDSKTMDVATYCNWVIDNYTDAKTVNLMKAMLNYGASAQLLFNYRTDDLANAALSDADKVLGKVDASAYVHSRTGEEEGIKPTTYTLLLDSETTVRVYFQLTGDKTIDEYTFTVDGVEVEPVYKDGLYYIQKTDIGAHRLDELHVFTCGGITITYGGLSYVNQVMTFYESGTTFDMASALFAYSKAAEAYIG